MTTATFGTSGTWTAPPGVTSVQAECWGEGGNGGTSAHGSHSGGGGGGGEYAENTSVPVTPGSVYSFTIGAGGSGTATVFTGDSSTVVTAHPGGNSPGQAAGSAGTGSTAPVHFDGGAGAAGSLGSSVAGGGGGSSAGAGAPGGAGSGATGGTAPSGGGNGGAGGTSLAAGTAGTAPGGAGGGGGSGGSINHSGGAGAAGQVTLTYSAATSHPGTASLAGTGTLGAAWAYLGAGVLSGQGAVTATGTASTITGANLAGSGAMTSAGALTYAEAAALTGTGTLSGHTIGFSSASLAGTGTITLVRSRESATALTGTGTLGAGHVVLGFTAALSGSGTVTVARVLGVVTAAAARGAVTTPYAWPGSSQVAVSAPGSSRLYWLGTLGHVTALTYSFVCPGGADKMTCTVQVPATYRTQMFNPGWTVRIFRGGHQVWSGKLDEPVPTAQGWTLTATGTGNLGQNFVALYSGTWPSGEPDVSVNAAIARGLPWVNPGIGTPAGAWFGQAVDSGAQTISDLLKLVCTRGGLTWYVNSQPGGVLGDDLSVFPLPTTVNRLLVATTPVGRTLGGDINTIFLRFQATADNSTTGASATYATTVVQNAASIAVHGTTEVYVDLSDAGTMSAGTAQQVGNYVLEIYQRASFSGPFTVHYGDLLNAGGSPVDLACDQAGTVCRLILTDWGAGGEVVPGIISFIVGSYSYDDIAQTATISPFQTLDQSISGLLSLESTILAPIAASS